MWMTSTGSFNEPPIPHHKDDCRGLEKLGLFTSCELTGHGNHNIRAAEGTVLGGEKYVIKRHAPPLEHPPGARSSTP